MDNLRIQKRKEQSSQKAKRLKEVLLELSMWSRELGKNTTSIVMATATEYKTLVTLM